MIILILTCDSDTVPLFSTVQRFPQLRVLQTEHSSVPTNNPIIDITYTQYVVQYILIQRLYHVKSHMNG